MRPERRTIGPELRKVRSLRAGRPALRLGAVLVLLEDAHWIDSTTLDQMIEPIGRQRVMRRSTG